MTDLITALLSRVLGRLPIGWLQLSHNRTRLMAAIAGVGFANLLVFVQLGLMGSVNTTALAPYALFRADIIVSSSDTDTLTEGSNVARQRLFQALGVPGVARGTGVWIGMLDWQRSDGSTSNLRTYAVDTDGTAFLAPAIAAQFAPLSVPDTVLLDAATRGAPAGTLDAVSPEMPYVFDAKGHSLSVVGTIRGWGGGFSSDGTMITSDQTFLALFPNRSASAPNHVLLQVNDGTDPAVVVDRLRALLPAESVRVDTLADAAAADLAYQATQRPTGIIFGFGVLIGVLVGIVIVYQILSSDVADHIKEYATFKAMGYGHGFFLGIVLEEAVILALLGFVPGLALSMAFYTGMGVATGLPITMEFGRAVLVLVGTVAACTLSGAIATRRLAAADPADLF